jgi:ribosomal protein L35
MAEKKRFKITGDVKFNIRATSGAKYTKIFRN